jgi:hypothetical protein
MHLRRLIRTFGILAVLAVPAAALAQTPAGSTTTMMQSSTGSEGIGIGVKGGVLMAKLTKEQLDAGFKENPGFIGGLFIGGNRGGRLGFGVDLMYKRESFKVPNGNPGHLDFINVPVYFRVNIGSESLNNVSIYALGGADLNFLLRASDGSRDDVTDNFERADYGYVVGLGVELTRFIVEGRFTKGLGNIVKATGAPQKKTQAIAVMIGLRFN